MSGSPIQWYPGHIARAERQLRDQIDRVDLVIEVRDARIPLATSHPRLGRWLQGRRHLLVLNRRDMVTMAARQAWDRWFRGQGLPPCWCDARAGGGVKALQQAAIDSGRALNERRSRRGMRPRPVRALTLGFPNVGKSALINRLVGQRVVASARRAGVTRSLRWVRLGQDLDLLDAPGVLPPRLDDQNAALSLAFCDDIGQASYDVEQVALAFLARLDRLQAAVAAPDPAALLEKRYGLPGPTAARERAEWLQRAADRHTSGDPARMAQRLLDDFRRLVLGPMALEWPPEPAAQREPEPGPPPDPEP
ncbi:ribosome biogenesis GTPase YlqF [Synechococcus sp. RSCCF101]|uniref:ribosome biogenesis GTPase YlqF n=1 Tax=Synechococcus sp. RSCCF101 TaxID=2511069 RepID=UPI001244FE99|nr:ribosome biogenesis GTPase YlqF [Synechococcus sp. RSCCF101]QEY32820.1 ribosome biogenesis GTPase YlqF [Synechococcus sp. RSCCF101]